MSDLMNALQSQTTPVVQIWMRWMAVMFLLALVFVKNHAQARRTLLALIGTVSGGYILWTMTENVHLLGIVHILIWFPLAVYLWITTLSKTARNHDDKADIDQYYTIKYKAFFYWVCLLFGTIVVCLVFDLRDIMLVMTGQK